MGWLAIQARTANSNDGLVQAQFPWHTTPHVLSIVIHTCFPPSASPLPRKLNVAVAAPSCNQSPIQVLLPEELLIRKVWFGASQRSCMFHVEKTTNWCSPEQLKLRLQHSLWHIPECAERAWRISVGYPRAETVSEGFVTTAGPGSSADCSSSAFLRLSMLHSALHL